MNLVQFQGPKDFNAVKVGIQAWLEARQNESLFWDKSPAETIQTLVEDVKIAERSSMLPWELMRLIQSNREFHTCHFCGTSVDANGLEYNGERHWLSDCRPDLVEHEIGEKCTWAFRRKPEFKRMKDETEDFPENHTCYAYQDTSQGAQSKWTWGTEHKHF